MTWGAEHGTKYGLGADVIDQLQAALDLLLVQLKGGPTTELVVQFIAERLQALEHDLHDTRWFRYLGQCGGTNLGHWGDLLGQRRESLSDADYRLILLTRMPALFSNRQSDVVLAVANALCSGSDGDGDGVTYTHDNDPPACIVIAFEGVQPSRSAFWNTVMRGAKPPGVRMVNTFADDACLDLDDATQGLDDPNIGLAHSYG